MFAFGKWVDEAIVQEIANDVIKYIGGEVDIYKTNLGWDLTFYERGSCRERINEMWCILEDSGVRTDSIWLHKQLNKVWIHTLYKRHGGLYLTYLKKDLCKGKDESSQFRKDVDEMLQEIKDDCKEK